MKDYSKYFLITSFFLIIVAFFTAHMGLREDYILFSSLATVFLALPSFYALYRIIGLNRSLALLGSVAVFAFIIESIGILTGFPYGGFEYSEFLGAKLFGLAPWTLPFAFIPLVLGSAYIASEIRKDAWWIPLSTAFLVGTDLVLDPAITNVGYWVWDTPGVYYGVPFTNFLGWILSGFIASSIVYGYLRKEIKEGKLRSGLVSSLFLNLVFFTAINMYLVQIIPGVLGLIGIYYVLRTCNDRIAVF